jgi:ubiquinol-cytochrome c reductase cytochrome b subunit
MFSAILIILILPFTDLSRSRGLQFRPLSKIAFFIFVGNFIILMQLGAKHVESPFIEFGQISTTIYFSYFLIILPLLSLLENSLIELEGEGNYINNKSITSLPLVSNIISINNLILFTVLFIIYSIIHNYDICDAPKP